MKSEIKRERRGKAVNQKRKKGTEKERGWKTSFLHKDTGAPTKETEKD